MIKILIHVPKDVTELVLLALIKKLMVVLLVEMDLFYRMVLVINLAMFLV